MGLVDKLFGNKSEKEIKRIEKYVDAIEALDEKMQALSDEELRAKTQEFKVSLRSKSKVDVSVCCSKRGSRPYHPPETLSCTAYGWYYSAPGTYR